MGEGLTTGVGAAAGEGTAALYERVGWIAATVGTDAGSEVNVVAEGGGAAAATKEPSAMLTRLRVGCFPLKNSDAVTEGSVEGTGGYISDWKESA